MTRPLRDRDSARWALGLLLVLIAVAVWTHAYHVVRAAAVSDGVDFAHWYANAHLIQQGVNLSHAYLTGSLEEAERATGGVFEPQPLQYPPSVFLVFAPLTRLTYASAYRWWVVACAACAWIGVWVCGRALPPAALSGRAVWYSAVGLTALFHPILQDLRSGQTMCVVLCAHAVGLALASRGHWAAGLAMALGNVLKPQFHLLWLLFLLWRRWRICLVWLLAAVGFEAIGWWWAGPGTIVDFVALRARYLEQGTLYRSAFSSSVMSLASRLLDLPSHPGLTSIILAAATVAGVGVFVWVGRLTWRYRQAAAPPWLAIYGLWAGAVLLAMPLLREHHLVVLLLPLLGVWWMLVERREAAIWAPRFLLTYGLVGAQYATSRFDVLQHGLPTLLAGGRLIGVVATMWWCHRVLQGASGVARRSDLGYTVRNVT